MTDSTPSVEADAAAINQSLSNPSEVQTYEPTEDGLDEAKKERRIGLPKPSAPTKWGMNPEDRLRVMEACLLLQRRGWRVNFTLMMAMAAIVAGMGLAADSPALVIGAMLIAPLMTPVLGIAASIAMVIGEALTRSIITVTLASVGVIGIGYLTGLVLPGDLMKSSEVLARTSPDVKDLVVAIAAGLAGSYATAKPDVSSSLPGVAVAVALVPPLVVVGLTLEGDRWDFARGSMLLYLTNLAGIVTLSTIVFVVTGFVPAHRLMELGPRVILGLAIGVVVIVALAVPLTITSIDTAKTSATRDSLEAAIRVWDDANSTFEVRDLTMDDFDEISIDVVGSESPTDTDELQARLEGIAERSIELKIVPFFDESTSTGRTSDDTDDVESAELDVVALNDTAQKWATENDVRVSTVEFDGTTVTVDLVGAQMPNAEDLKAILTSTAGPDATVEVWFTQRTLVLPTPTPPPSPTATPTPEPTATPRPTSTPWAFN